MMTGLLGVAASFIPQELLNGIGLPSTPLSALGVQIAGALYLGFAMMNWMSRTVVIGGIYARPLAMGNFSHFAIAALALMKAASANTQIQFVWPATILYAIFAVLFGVVLFTTPKKLNG